MPRLPCDRNSCRESSSQSVGLTSRSRRRGEFLGGGFLRTRTLWPLRVFEALAFDASVSADIVAVLCCLTTNVSERGWNDQGERHEGCAGCHCRRERRHQQGHSLRLTVSLGVVVVVFVSVFLFCVCSGDLLAFVVNDILCCCEVATFRDSRILCAQSVLSKKADILKS